MLINAPHAARDCSVDFFISLSPCCQKKCLVFDGRTCCSAIFHSPLVITLFPSSTLSKGSKMFMNRLRGMICPMVTGFVPIRARLPRIPRLLFSLLLFISIGLLSKVDCSPPCRGTFPNLKWEFQALGSFTVQKAHEGNLAKRVG